MPVQLHLKHVLGSEKSIDMFNRQRHFMLAYPVQQVFQHMGDLGHIHETESGRATLDRMCGTENGVQVLVVRILDINGQQQALGFRQQLFRFIEEDLIKLAHIHCHRTTPGYFLVIWARFICSRRFLRKLTDHFLHNFDQALGVERLDQPAIGSSSLAFCLHLIAGLRGQHQDRHFLVRA